MIFARSLDHLAEIEMEEGLAIIIFVIIQRSVHNFHYNTNLFSPS